MPQSTSTDKEDKIAKFYRYWEMKRSVDWHLRFIWLPKRCKLTRKLIWMESAYCGRIDFALDVPSYYVYAKKQNFLMWMLSHSHQTKDDYFRNGVV